MATLRSPKSLGPAVATVSEIHGDRVHLRPLTQTSTSELDPCASLAAGDGVVFFDAQGDLHGSTINGVGSGFVQLQSPQWLLRGTTLHRNHDAAYLARASRSSPARVIRLTISVQTRVESMRVVTLDEDGVTAELALRHDGASARDTARAQALATEQFERTGGTEFEVSRVEFLGTELPHWPRSRFNALRRELLEAHSNARAALRPRTVRAPAMDPAPLYPQRHLDFRANVLNQKALAFLREHGVESVEPGAESGLTLTGRTVMTMRYCILHELGYCPRTGGTMPAAAPYSLVDEAGRRLRLVVNCQNCTTHLVLEQGSLESH